jgi:hypothetical protein
MEAYRKGELDAGKEYSAHRHLQILPMNISE